MNDAFDSEQGALELGIDEPGPPLIQEQGETEDDLESHDPTDFQAAVSATDWTVETIVNQMRKSRVNLNPHFQRRNAWLAQRKSQLIESMMLRYPIPQLVLAERKDAEGNYFVIDGKQRLLALRQFFVEKGDGRDEGFEPLRLRGLEILSDLNGMDWADVQAQRPDLAAKLENHTIRTVFLSHWENEDLLLSLFLRLNTGSVALSPQELRQALLPGPFVEWVDLQSGESAGLRNLLGNIQPDRRMVDAELLLRFLALTRTELKYAGNLKKFLDETCREFNSNWEQMATQAEQGLSRLEQAIAAAVDVFPDNAVCRKWSSGKFERPFNRALFDVQIGVFALPEVLDRLPGRESDVLQGFKNLCETSPRFVHAITSTTKTREALITRFGAFGDMVGTVLGVQVPLPRPLT